MNTPIIKVSAGTAATLNIPLGFTPDWVKITDTTNLTQLLWDTNDSVNTNGIAVAAAGTRTKAANAAAGVAVYAGSVGSAAKGITLGATAAVNQNGVELLVEAGCYKN